VRKQLERRAAEGDKWPHPEREVPWNNGRWSSPHTTRASILLHDFHKPTYPPTSRLKPPLTHPFTRVCRLAVGQGPRPTQRPGQDERVRSRCGPIKLHDFYKPTYPPTLRLNPPLTHPFKRVCRLASESEQSDSESAATASCHSARTGIDSRTLSMHELLIG
jgi:hypothetical protein